MSRKLWTCTQLHTWNSKADDVERPDRIVFDLDPGRGVAWSSLVVAAAHVREALGAVGLKSWVKTTGGKGLHVVVPLEPNAGWDECFAFTRSLAEKMAAEAPNELVATMGEGNRVGKIFIDYLRNNRTATSVAAYSTRARTGAPVSTPIAWSALTASKPLAFGMDDAVARTGDEWRSYWTCRQRLPQAPSARGTRAPGRRK